MNAVFYLPLVLAILALAWVIYLIAKRKKKTTFVEFEIKMANLKPEQPEQEEPKDQEPEAKDGDEDPRERFTALVVQLHKEGLSQRQIAAQLGVGRTTIQRTIKRVELNGKGK